MEKDKEILALRMELINAKAEFEINCVKHDFYEKALDLKNEAAQAEIAVLQKANEDLQKLLDEFET